MADAKHKVERAAFGAAIDGILKYVNKDEADREKAFLKLVDLSEKFMGDTFRKEGYDAARRMIQDPDSKWMQYVNRILNEVDPHVIKMSALDYGFEAAFCGKKEINEMRVKHQCNIPWLILMDPTSACNLHCTGCWAAEYGNRLNLSFEDMDRIVTQGKELGIYLYFFTGGEPLVRKDDIIRLCEKHDDCGFHAFTNGTLIDEKFCQDMKRVGNFSVAISLEGFNEVNDLRRGKGVFDKVMHAMDLMKQYGLIFGTSICYTSKNYKVVTSDEFLDMIIEKGARFSWYFHYMPVGNEASCELLPDPDQREYMYHRIREIRASERKFYQKITDLYATAIDYDKNAATTRRFYATVQNKMHYAVHGHTAAELIVKRADHTKEHMGLTTWADAPDGKIKKSDVTVAKNYLSQDEMKQLNRMVTAYLDFAENMTLRHIPLTMQDWEKRLNGFIEMFDYGILQDAGKVSAEIAKLHAETEFEKYRVIQDRLFMSDFDKYMLELEENAKK